MNPLKRGDPGFGDRPLIIKRSSRFGASYRTERQKIAEEIRRFCNNAGLVPDVDYDEDIFDERDTLSPWSHFIGDVRRTLNQNQKEQLIREIQQFLTDSGLQPGIDYDADIFHGQGVISPSSNFIAAVERTLLDNLRDKGETSANAQLVIPSIIPQPPPPAPVTPQTPAPVTPQPPVPVTSQLPSLVTKDPPAPLAPLTEENKSMVDIWSFPDEDGF